ncbi:hypothetical protein TeGR_g1468 [Tetraparma gracilis]|uniref:Uncharacterized protein n=1 Tax=Tetraparma gracilis TaxID=2962635 RepID=A0ABQ6M648_9STRA|nr:hypothetical protein TeGR_g1468 [Tetraparma gracilis]
MPDYSDWAREISEGTLEGIIEQLEACVDDKDNENGPHVLLMKETEFVAALVSLACDSGDLGDAATRVLWLLALPKTNQLPLFQFPGLLDALIASPHVDLALNTLTCLSCVEDEAQRIAMATNTALIDRLVANAGGFDSACMVLYNLCRTVDNNRALLYEHPGLIAAVTDATRVPACADEAVGVLANMSLSDSLMMPMPRNPLVLDAVLRAAGSDIDQVAERAIICLYNLSLESENRALMRDDVRIMDALTARVDHEDSKETLFIICYIGALPHNFPPSLDLSFFCSRPFNHQLSLVKALIREHPEQLSVQDSSGRAPLVLAQAAHLPAPVIGLLSDCDTASALDFSLTHLVGYTRLQIALARAQRYALMCSLERAANKRRKLPVEGDVPGELNAGKALRGYLNGGKDPWSIIGCFAF